MMIGAVVLNAVSTVLYIGAGLGPGPRDGLMTGLVARTGLSVRLVRTSIEARCWSSAGCSAARSASAPLVYAFGIGPWSALSIAARHPQGVGWHAAGGPAGRESSQVRGGVDAPRTSKR